MMEFSEFGLSKIRNFVTKIITPWGCVKKIFFSVTDPETYAHFKSSRIEFFFDTAPSCYDFGDEIPYFKFQKKSENSIMETHYDRNQ